MSKLSTPTSPPGHQTSLKCRGLPLGARTQRLAQAIRPVARTKGIRDPFAEHRPEHPIGRTVREDRHQVAASTIPRQTAMAQRLGSGLSRRGRAPSQLPSTPGRGHPTGPRGRPLKDLRSQPLRLPSTRCVTVCLAETHHMPAAASNSVAMEARGTGWVPTWSTTNRNPWGLIHATAPEGRRRLRQPPRSSHGGGVCPAV